VEIIMTYAYRSASLNERTGTTAGHKSLPVFRAQKRTVRLSACNPVKSELRSSAEIRPETAGMKAFEEMIVASRQKFLATAKAILRNKEDAEDAVQNAILSGYLHLPGFEGRSALKTWFTRIVINAALMIRRKQKLPWMCAQPESENPDDDLQMERIRSSEPDPEMVYAELETFQHINEAIGKMKPELRQVYTLTYCDEMSSLEARALLGVSSAAFKSRLLRARRQLLKQVQRIRVARIGGATSCLADKNPFQPLEARQPQTGLLEVSLS
jgi:RNA polymerase sigma-70 factor (ECF subfamily)